MFMTHEILQTMAEVIGKNCMILTFKLFHNFLIGFTKNLLQSLLLKVALKSNWRAVSLIHVEITRCYKQWEKASGKTVWVVTLSLFHNVEIGFTKSLQQSLLPKVALESYWKAVALTYVYDPPGVINNDRNYQGKPYEFSYSYCFTTL